jgi:multiple sugar transport system ATP-binding protein
VTSVVFENVVKRYGKTQVVHNLNLEIKPQEFVVMIGPSGCGKSTTLRMVAGLETVTQGQLKIANIVVNDLPPVDRKVSMVFQSYALYPHMNVYNNIAFGLKIRGLAKSDIERKISETAETLGLTPYLKRKPSQLSGGQRQRVAMGRALVQDPKVFLFDEPLSNLDTQLRHQMRQEIRELHQRLKTTTLYVTHDQVEAMTLADRIVVMRAGIMEQAGTPDELFSRPANLFVAQFLGYPNINTFQGQLIQHEDQMAIDVNGLKFQLQANQGEMLKGVRATEGLIVGIRPFHLRIGETSGDNLAIVIKNARVDRVEPLGGKYLLSLSAQNNQFVTELKTEHPPKPGDILPLSIKSQDVLVFDQKTEKSYFSP